jgi:hypothetical protein
MARACLTASGILLFGLAATAMSLPAQALTMKECSAKYQAAKEAGTLDGMKWNDFRKAQCGDTATPAVAPEKTATPAAAGESAGKPGRQAYLGRLHACSAEWKAAKANGTRPAGMHWPQFWHECDERQKAKGM